MKKLVIGGLLFALAGTSAIFAVSQSRDLGSVNAESQVIPLSELTQERAEGFFSGNAQFILECTEGMILPFNFSVHGEFLAFNSENIPREIKVLKTCYIKHMVDAFLFSTDLQDWKQFQDFFTGRVEASLNVKDSIPTIDIQIELNQSS